MRKLSANTNKASAKVFDIELLKRKPFELSRLEGFVEGDDDIFDVLSKDYETPREHKQV